MFDLSESLAEKVARIVVRPISGGSWDEATEQDRHEAQAYSKEIVAALRAPFDALRNGPQFVGGPSVVLRRDLDAAINEAFGPKPKPEPEKRYVHYKVNLVWHVADTSGAIRAYCADEHDAIRITDALNATIVTVAGRPLAEAMAERGPTTAEGKSLEKFLE